MYGENIKIHDTPLLRRFREYALIMADIPIDGLAHLGKLLRGQICF